MIDRPCVWRLAFLPLVAAAAGATWAQASPKSPPPGGAPRLVTLTAAQPQPDDPAATGDSDSDPIPDTPAGRQLKWVVDYLNTGQDLDPAALGGRMSERFKETTSPTELISLLKTMRETTLGGRKVGIERIMDDGEHAVGGILRTDRNRVSVFIVVHDETGELTELRFGPAGYVLDDAGDWDGLDNAMRDLPGLVNFGAFEIVTDDAASARQPELSPKPTRLHAIHQFGEEHRLAIGSTAKLFILGALAEQAAAGKFAWDDKLPIRDELKSLPSGTMQALPAGEEHPIREFAERMMAISDNTAADHLAQRVGRDAIDAYFKQFSDSPALTLPFLRTMEAFKLKLGTPDLAEEYVDLDEDAQKRFLTEDGGRLAGVKVERASLREWSDPVLIGAVEWFATAEECAKVMQDLRRLEQHALNAPLGELMRKNPGLRLDRERWPSIAYKGGSEPGVLNMTWLLGRDDGRWYVLSVGWNDPERALEEAKFIALAKKGIALLDQHASQKAVEASKSDVEKPEDPK